MQVPFFKALVRLLPALATSPLVSAVELPKEPLAALGNGDFKSRENGQAEVLAWARLEPEPSMEKLLEFSLNSDDPEVRERCMDVLRSLVMDQYMSEGPGFLGINYDKLALEIKNGPDTFYAIRVKQVSRETPAEQAGFKAGDAIIALNGKGWDDATATDDFKLRIAAIKPGTKVKLSVLRAGEQLDKEVVLMRRPLSADPPTIFGFNGVDPDAEEQALKEAYFRDWLNQRMSRK